MEDAGVDAVFVEPTADERAGLLIVRPNQSFESAVNSCVQVAPSLHPDAVRGLLRQHMHAAATFESLLPRYSEVGTLVDDAPAARPRWHRPVTLIALSALSGVLLTIGSYVLLLASDVVTPVELTGDSVFQTAGFLSFADNMEWSCTALGELTAQCTDGEGGTIMASAALLDRGTLYRFGFEDDGLYLGVFDAADRAEGFVRSNRAGMAGSEHVDLRGRFAVAGGTVEQRARVWDAMERGGLMKDVDPLLDVADQEGVGL